MNQSVQEPSIASHPDRLLPTETGARNVARELLADVENLPIISPHGHVPASLFVDDAAFPDPTALLITPDHYVTRLIHSSGIPLHDLGVGNPSVDSREAWRRFAKAWPLFEGTASGYWLRGEFEHIFDIPGSLIDLLPSGGGDAVYDALTTKLTDPEFRPRQLFTGFGLEVLATTDDPLDSLGDHATLAADPTFSGRVLPTFRPDAYLNPSQHGWQERVSRLMDEAAEGLTGFAGYLRALENRRAHFIEHGAVSADHGVRTPRTVRLEAQEAASLFSRAQSGLATAADQELFEAHMLYEMARMSVEDGLVMTLHPGSFRNHHTPSLERYGPDTGHDIPIAINYTEGIRPILQHFGDAEGFHLVLFTLDETVLSREIAPMAGFYPSVFIGAPWWFLDAPDAMLRFRSAITETAGFSRTSGFIDDTRAFCSIPARHDASRRIEASFLARLVTEHRISEERAHELIVDIVDRAPRRVFKL
ncbi:glucuronate isomerase [Arthrobacter sp. zg-Y769]|uniref:glucuronate isomerase n=1 Tax=Arthrobacter sp. zg-Y769 TaxID=2894191 RepID=UPI002F3E4BD2|nr:glucuronate isomerase [Arthrobacter sp. zg-Y769]